MINELIKVDKSFNEANFYGYVGNIFVKLYTGVMLQDIEQCRHFLSDDVYNKYKNKINNLKQNNQREMFDELNIAASSIINIDIQEIKLILSVKLTAKYLHYLMNTNNNKIISGNKNQREVQEYLLTFVKSKDTEKDSIVTQCPNCGASLNINHSGICPYCNTTYDLKNKDYILTEIQEI